MHWPTWTPSAPSTPDFESYLNPRTTVTLHVLLRTVLRKKNKQKWIARSAEIDYTAGRVSERTVEPGDPVKKILLINLSYKKVYEEAKVKAGVPHFPPVSLASLAGVLLQNGHQVRIFDFNVVKNTRKDFIELAQSFSPEFIGITFTTTLFHEMLDILALSRECAPQAFILAGGPHASSFPERTLKESGLDAVVVGEGEYPLLEAVSGKRFEDIKSLCYRKNGEIMLNERREPSETLDELPFPAWHLYDITQYKTPRLTSRRNPVGWMETSRGCVYGCIYCNKSIFGRRFRTKSAERVVAEMEYMLSCGFREIHLADDCFTTDMKRASGICDLIIEKKLKFLWAAITGIRVDRVDRELLHKMKRAGCYKVFFGVESGSQQILNNVQKGTNLDQIRNAVAWAKEAGLETWGAFMIGLPGETEQTMEDTIRFAQELDVDIAKLSITIPLPATKLYDDLKKGGYIKTEDWKKFNFYVIPSELYDHPNLSWNTIEKYYNRFYREFYFRPSFIAKRFIKGIRTGTIFDDFLTLVETKW